MGKRGLAGYAENVWLDFYICSDLNEEVVHIDFLVALIVLIIDTLVGD